MMEFLTKFPEDEGVRVKAGHILLPNEASSTRTGLHPIELLTKSFLPMEISNNPGFCQEIGYSV